MYIVMNMNIYISKENEAYLRTLQGSMSGYINGLIVMDKAEAKEVRQHVVDEGVKLGKIKSVPTPSPQSPAEEQKITEQLDKVYTFCKHNNLRGFCKHGC